MPYHLKLRWNEARGDAYVHWGASWWYFEVDDDGHALRQIEQYDAGPVLKYSEAQLEDAYGGLAEEPVMSPDDPDATAWLPMTAQDFETLWQRLPAHNAA